MIARGEFAAVMACGQNCLKLAHFLYALQASAGCQGRCCQYKCLTFTDGGSVGH